MPDKTLIFMLVLACAPAAQAHRSHGRDVVGFATSRCASASCFSKHPGGNWRHPLTAPTGRWSQARSYPGGART